MATYDLYPSIDSNYNFPPAIRQALAQAAELTVSAREIADTRISLLAVKKGEIVLNLADSAAKLDGVTNDTSAIQSFVNSAPSGATIIMPAGKTAKLNDVITLSKPVKISDWRLKLGTNNKGLKVKSSDVTITDCVLTGVGISAGYVMHNRAILAAGSSSTIYNNVNIVNNQVTGINDTCIQLEWVTNSSVINNTCTTFNYAGIMLISGVDVDIMKNNVSGAVHNKNTNSYGIAVSDLENTIAARSTRVRVHGNTIRNIPDWEGIDTHGGSFVSIVGNTVIGARRAIQALVGNDDRVTAPQHTVIVGNVVDGSGVNGAATGITLYGKSDGSMLADGIVSGNAIYNCNTPLQIDYTDPTKTSYGNNAGAPQIDTTESDTGWVSFPANLFQTGWSSNSTYPARYRIIKKGSRTMVELDGVVSRVSGAGTNILLLPAEARPGYAKVIGTSLTTSNTPVLGALDIHVEGYLRFVFTAATSGNVAITSSYVL